MARIRCAPSFLSTPAGTAWEASVRAALVERARGITDEDRGDHPKGLSALVPPLSGLLAAAPAAFHEMFVQPNHYISLFLFQRAWRMPPAAPAAERAEAELLVRAARAARDSTRITAHAARCALIIVCKRLVGAGGWSEHSHPKSYRVIMDAMTIAKRIALEAASDHWLAAPAEEWSQEGLYPPPNFPP